MFCISKLRPLRFTPNSGPLNLISSSCALIFSYATMENEEIIIIESVQSTIPSSPAQIPGSKAGGPTNFPERFGDWQQWTGDKTSAIHSKQFGSTKFHNSSSGTIGEACSRNGDTMLSPPLASSLPTAPGLPVRSKIGQELPDHSPLPILPVSYEYH